jgi:hypothetical protein
LDQRAGSGCKNPLLRFDPATQCHHCLLVKLADSGFAHTLAFSEKKGTRVLHKVDHPVQNLEIGQGLSGHWIFHRVARSFAPGGVKDCLRGRKFQAKQPIIRE